MPKRTDIKSILIIGSGPIVIGQACEFDYSGTQACRVLKKEGYRIILANSNPATIMTDPEFADSTYIEPLTCEFIEKIIIAEKPDACLPTLGGQTALNLAMELSEKGIFQKYGVELIGANETAINTAENRQVFKEAMEEIGLKTARSATAHDMNQARKIAQQIGFPIIIRPAYILGGQGTGIAQNSKEFEKLAAQGLDASPITEILVEQSVLGWKEYELEVMRDKNDNCVVVCSIENVDAMGVHTGDSITVAPIQTLTDSEYQKMRDAAFACLRRVGVETGGSNVQFAVNPKNGEQIVIEMNPRVSRSSALASKATGFPIAKIAALLAIGCTLDEITNDITKKTPVCFEPSIDYVVTKIPRWNFDKFPKTPAVLGTQMQAVGEVMAIGRTFPESLQKAIRSLETGRDGLNADAKEVRLDKLTDSQLLATVKIPTPERIFAVENLIRRKVSLEKISKASGYDPWFLYQIQRISEARLELQTNRLDKINSAEFKHYKQLGFSNAQIAYLTDSKASQVAKTLQQAKIRATYKTVDTCAAEFASETPYYYSTWEDENEAIPSQQKKVLILGSGPNRIGQGIEFDYTCVHASFAAHESGYESIMLNCNPETVSTDYDTSDRLYFEPITIEDVMNVVNLEKPDSIIVSLGGQTPLKLASFLPRDLILGTKPDAIDLAEDRDRWNELCKSIGIPQPNGGTAINLIEAKKVAEEIGFPLLVRPSYVLGGQSMKITNNIVELEKAFRNIADNGKLEHPALIDQFIDNAIEIDVDSIRDKTGEIFICGIMEHVEQAGIHSGDSACMLPTQNISKLATQKIKKYTEQIATALDVVGLINIQFVVKNDDVYVIEANPRASRTVPFIAKATGVPVAKIATRVMLGDSLADLRQKKILSTSSQKFVAVKEAVLPTSRFPYDDSILSPEMHSTGESMGIGTDFSTAFAKAEIAAGTRIPKDGTVFITVADSAKPLAVQWAKRLTELGFQLVATTGTKNYLEKYGVSVQHHLGKIHDNDKIQLPVYLENNQIELIINIPSYENPGAQTDGLRTRQMANKFHIPIVTTSRATDAILDSIADNSSYKVQPIQLLHQTKVRLRA